MTMPGLDTYARLASDFPFYARFNLKILDKGGLVSPFQLNQAQLHVNERLEAQKAATGKVRALILKARQQGCSTYISGRFLHQTTLNAGQKCFIMAHKKDATDNLFGMAERFYKHLPDPLKPRATAASAKELAFGEIESGYAVGTAGGDAVGRSSTIRRFHGSEVAFWDNAEEHLAGIFQAVPDLPGTEIILESTANGLGNMFHKKCMEALAGQGEFILVFTPWFWQPEYTSAVPVELETADQEYGEMYKLTKEQLYWRRRKIIEFGNEWQFKQEYPANPVEAFQSSGENGFILPETVLRARKCPPIQDMAPIVLGVDPARGRDRTAFAWRTGRVCTKFETYLTPDLMGIVGKTVNIIKADDPAMVFIDICGIGAGVVDRLRELGYGHRIMGINAGEKALASDRYVNRRAEMWDTMRQWLLEQPCKVPDSDDLHADLTGMCFDGGGYDSLSRLKLESKDKMRARGLKSPDIGDALALTFSLPLPALSRIAPGFGGGMPLRQSRADGNYLFKPRS